MLCLCKIPIGNTKTKNKQNEKRRIVGGGGIVT
jgi:hypothetical protein